MHESEAGRHALPRVWKALRDLAGQAQAIHLVDGRPHGHCPHHTRVEQGQVAIGLLLTARLEGEVERRSQRGGAPDHHQHAAGNLMPIEPQRVGRVGCAGAASDIVLVGVAEGQRQVLPREVGARDGADLHRGEVGLDGGREEGRSSELARLVAAASEAACRTSFQRGLAVETMSTEAAETMSTKVLALALNPALRTLPRADGVSTHTLSLSPYAATSPAVSPRKLWADDRLLESARAARSFPGRRCRFTGAKEPSAAQRDARTVAGPLAGFRRKLAATSLDRSPTSRRRLASSACSSRPTW